MFENHILGWLPAPEGIHVYFNFEQILCRHLKIWKVASIFRFSRMPNILKSISSIYFSNLLKGFMCHRKDHSIKIWEGWKVGSELWRQVVTNIFFQDTFHCIISLQNVFLSLQFQIQRLIDSKKSDKYAK